MSELFPPGECGEDLRGKFLTSLANGKGGYRRYRGPLRYGGGKSLAVGDAIAALPRHEGRAVSPFLGGGSVEAAMAQELGMEVRGYDILEPLTCWWKEQLSDPERLAGLIRRWKPDRETYRAIKERLRAHWEGTSKLSPPETGAHFWFNHQLSYGPGFLGWGSSVYLQEGRFARMVERLRIWRCPGLSAEGPVSFEESIPAHPGDLLYLDPPYMLGEDSAVFRGVYPHRNFPVHHHGFDHAALRDLLCTRRGPFLLHYNDHPLVREWYREFEIKEVSWRYTMSLGETRIGKNRKKEGRGTSKRSSELLIIKRS